MYNSEYFYEYFILPFYVTRDYYSYSGCIHAVNSTCPSGVQEAYDASPDSRVYLLKMSYICENNQKGMWPNMVSAVWSRKQCTA